MMDDRAQIAAICLQALMSNPDYSAHSPEDITTWAVEHADMLIAELSKTPPPARTKEPPSPPTDPGNGEAGEPEANQGKEDDHARAPVTPGIEGAASARAEQGLASAESGAHRIDPPTVSNLTSPVSVFDCEARFEHDPVCPGPVAFDPVSKGRFCGLHAQIPEGHRREMHRLHGHRNRPLAPVERLAG